MPSMNGEVALIKWMMDIDTLECSGQRGSHDLEELVSGDYLAFGSLIWHKELTCLTLLFLAGFQTMFFELGAGD